MNGDRRVVGDGEAVTAVNAEGGEIDAQAWRWEVEERGAAHSLVIQVTGQAAAGNDIRPPAELDVSRGKSARRVWQWVRHCLTAHDGVGHDDRDLRGFTYEQRPIVVRQPTVADGHEVAWRWSVCEMCAEPSSEVGRERHGVEQSC